MTTIIAEAGVNHNGSVELAEKLIDAAKEAGADYIKFQTFCADEIASKAARQAEYQAINTSKKESQREMLKQLELSNAEFIYLKDYCNKAGIKFLSTGFSPKSMTFLNGLGMDYIKIPSGEITNILLLERSAKLVHKKKIILSTGMCNIQEVREAVEKLKSNGVKDNQLVILHCTTEYPAPPESVNLRAIKTMKDEFGCDIGYSDHTDGIHIAIAAVTMGAQYIEKHFTLDKNLSGPDHKASITPDELSKMISNIRDIESCLGTGVKEIHPLEEKNREVARRSITAMREIKEGEIFSYENIGLQRPGGGISGMKYYDYIGKRARKNFSEGDYVQ